MRSGPLQRPPSADLPPKSTDDRHAASVHQDVAQAPGPLVEAAGEKDGIGPRRLIETADVTAGKDEAFLGSKRKNMSKARRRMEDGRGTVGKSVAVGLKDRGSNQVRAKVVRDTTASTLQGFVRESTEKGAMVYTDEAKAYNGLAPRYSHEAVNHGVGEHVRGQAHKQGIESFWSMLKRTRKDVYHKISAKHLDRYVNEFAGGHNVRELDTIEQMGTATIGMVGRLMHRNLIADNSLDNGARS